MKKPKLIRITTVPQSLRGLLRGQLKFMTQNGFEVVGVSSPGEALQDVKKNEGIRVVPLEMTRTISPFKDLKAVYQLYKLFKKEKPTIVHTHTPKAGTLGMLAAKLAGIPHRLHTIAGLPLLEAKGKKRTLLNLVEKVTYACATNIYPNSNGLKDTIQKNNFTKPNKLKVLGQGSSNGIDTSFFDPNLFLEKDNEKFKETLGLKSTDFVFLYVGRVVKDKGINELVKSFGMLNKNHPTTKLILVGSFERNLDALEPNTEKIINTNPNILAVGYQKDVRPYFSMADVFTFPSYREGFPNVVMQSCAMGVASIVTNINGCNEIVKDGKNGLIIPSHNKDELYEKMIFLYENPGIRKQLAAKSREKVVNNYERKYVWSEILKEYNFLLEK